MADPKKEQGFTAVANETLESLAKLPLNGTQFRIVLIVLRFTYGFNRKEHALSLSFISKAINGEKMQVKRAVDKLIEYNILIVEKEAGFRNSRLISFNSDYETYKLDYSSENSLQSTNKPTLQYAKQPTLEYANQPTKKEIIKENIKKDIYTEIFDFWNSKKIIVHKKLTKQTESKINARLKDYSEEEIKQAITNYKTIIDSEKYFFTYKWSLRDFLKPDNFEKFLSVNEPFNSYLSNEYKKKAVQEPIRRELKPVSELRREAALNV